MMMSFKQSKLTSTTLQVLYYKSSKTSNLPLEGAAALCGGSSMRFFSTAAAAATKKMSVSERLRLMVEQTESMASKVRQTKQTQGIHKAGGASHPRDE